MIKRLTRHGNSLALVIDRGVLDLLDIGADTPLSISTDGSCLIIAPVRDVERLEKFKAVSGKANARYGRGLKRLAD
ncbi:MAG: AbrB/MazE/SpoVT family DNA-binding domain-containing protein [Pseudomonadota bacterium]